MSRTRSHVGIPLNGKQTTIRSRTSLTGVGVHSGKAVTIHFLPGEADTGVVFHRSHKGELASFRGHISDVGATAQCTVLGDPARDHVATVEHLMAAIYALQIDNLVVEVEGTELPILDGSAALLVDALDGAGIEVLDGRRRFIRILKTVRVENGASWAEFSPHAGTRFEVGIDFESPAIGRQTHALELDAEDFRRNIARARTFGFMKDVERLWAAGLALGSSLENSVVIGDDHRVINMEGLRYPDEFVRHKMLDAIGDVALVGARFIGSFRSYRGGHSLNAAIVRKLLAERAAYDFVEATPQPRGRTIEIRAGGAPVYAPVTN